MTNAANTKTPDDICDRARQALGGHGWITRLAKLTGVHYATAKRWAAGELVFPQYARTIIELIESGRIDPATLQALRAR